jgi:hypothetical protein
MQVNGLRDATTQYNISAIFFTLYVYFVFLFNPEVNELRVFVFQSLQLCFIKDRHQQVANNHQVRFENCTHLCIAILLCFKYSYAIYIA